MLNQSIIHRTVENSLAYCRWLAAAASWHQLRDQGDSRQLPFSGTGAMDQLASSR